MTPEMLATLTEQVAELVQTYSNNYLQFQRATYNETQVRVDFVNRFFKLLGWDVDNERGLPQHLREVTHEATVVVEEDGVHRSKKPDYSFKVGTEVLYFLETKKPAVNLTIDAAPAFQLRRYGWSGNLKVSVLTNFTDLYIYDCSVRPREGDDIGIAMIAHYHFDEYVERFEEIYNMLSKEAVLTGQFEHHFGNIQGALRREPFDQYFLDQIIETFTKAKKGIQKGIDVCKQQLDDLDGKIVEAGKNITSVQPTVDEINRSLKSYGFTNASLITTQNIMRRILENYFSILGKTKDDTIVDSFSTIEEKMICRSLLSWINDGSHTIPDDLYIDSYTDSIDRYKQIFKEVFFKMGHEAHYKMMMGES